MYKSVDLQSALKAGRYDGVELLWARLSHIDASGVIAMQEL